MAKQQRLPKMRRAPECVAGKPITERSLRIIEAIARYRFLRTSDIVRLAEGNEDVTHRHLQQLYHQDFISRFALPTDQHKGEFIYFLDNASALRKLVASSPLNADQFDWNEIKANREKYSEVEERSVGRFLFIEHELMLSSFHADVEVAARQSDAIVLHRWSQGAALWNRVSVGKRVLPHRPDALFALHFPHASEGNQFSNFLYEADRETCNMTRLALKLEAHTHFLMQGKHTESYGIRKVRAVLFETLTTRRAQHLRKLAAALADMHPVVGVLFWFASKDDGAPPFSRRWQCAGDATLRSVAD